MQSSRHIDLRHKDLHSTTKATTTYLLIYLPTPQTVDKSLHHIDLQIHLSKQVRTDEET